MSRRVLLVVLLSISLTAFCQVSVPQNQDNANQPAITPLPAGYGGTVWTGPGAAGGVLLTTPSANFPTPAPTAGISMEGRAGISNNAPNNTGVSVTAPAATYVYAPYSTPAAENAPGAGTETETGQPSEVSLSSLLPSYATNNVGTPVNGNGPSLAEIAARYGRRGILTAGGKQNIRTFTNADVPQQNAGLLTPILVAEGKLPVNALGSPQLMASAAPGPRVNGAPAGSGSQSSNANSAPGQGGTGNQHSDLPASASPLPLLGLLGLFSGGLGLVLRRRR